jgi:iron complex transport system substrate-binding protein
VRAVAGVGLILLLLTACGRASFSEPARSAPTDTAAPSGEAPSTDATAGTAGDAFPVTIAHTFGSTEITAPPERIVTVGRTDHDAVLALGVQPVGVRDWFGEQPFATWPWAQDELGEAEPAIVGTAEELDFEQVAVLDPDVIIGLSSAMEQDTYDMLSQIAPTVAPPADQPASGITWQEITRTVGQVLGREELADALIADIDQRFAAARRTHPVFDGATAAIAVPDDGIYVYGDEVANGRVLGTLGFALPPELDKMIGDRDGANLTPGHVDLLDTDVLIWLDATPEDGLPGGEMYQRLDVHRRGREIFLESSSPLGGAMSFSSVLSLPHVVDHLVPLLAAAVDGEPGTEVPTGG